jgi:hypothetical protein
MKIKDAIALINKKEAEEKQKSKTNKTYSREVAKVSRFIILKIEKESREKQENTIIITRRERAKIIKNGIRQIMKNAFNTSMITK